MAIAPNAVRRPLTVANVTAAEVSAVIDPLFREYGEWVSDRPEQDAGITYTGADLIRHHDAFGAELPRLLALAVGCSSPAWTGTRSALGHSSPSTTPPRKSSECSSGPQLGGSASPVQSSYVSCRTPEPRVMPLSGSRPFG